MRGRSGKRQSSQIYAKGGVTCRGDVGIEAGQHAQHAQRQNKEQGRGAQTYRSASFHLPALFHHTLSYHANACHNGFHKRRHQFCISLVVERILFIWRHALVLGLQMPKLLDEFRGF